MIRFARLLVLVALSASLGACCVLAPKPPTVFHAEFANAENGTLWAIKDAEYVRVKQRDPLGHFSGPYLHVDAGEGSGPGTHMGVFINAQQKRFLSRLFKQAPEGGQHRLNGGISFLARPTAHAVSGNKSFAPFDWKFGEAQGDDLRVRFEMHSDADGSLRIGFTTVNKAAMVLPNGDVVSRATGVSTEGNLFRSGELYNIALLFRTDAEGTVLMRAFVERGGSCIDTDKLEAARLVFQLDETVLPQLGALVARDNVFGIMSPNPAFTDHVEFDDLRVYDHVPRIIPGK